MKVRITNSADGNTSVLMRMTPKQFKFLQNIAEELNTKKDREMYSPTLFVQEVQ